MKNPSVTDEKEKELDTILELPKESKQSVAYSYLRSAIITGRYPPEKPLVEREICDKLGVSRTPVREALRRLGSEGLVDFIPNRGVFVSGISKEKAMQLYEMKEALEGMAAKLCAERGGPECVRLLEECIKMHRGYAERGEMDIAVDLDLRFHVLLVENCGNAMIAQHAKSLLLQTRRLSQLAVYDADYVYDFIGQHEYIVDRIRSGDGNGAVDAVGRHIRFIQKFQWERWGMLF